MKDYKRTLSSWLVVPVAALLGAISAVGLLAFLNGTERANGASRPWTIQIEAERRCVNGVRRDLPLPGSFRFRWQGDSAVGAEGWQTSFQFTTTQANGRHFQHIADCDVSLEEHRGTAVVATVGETVQHSIEFAW